MINSYDSPFLSANGSVDKEAKSKSEFTFGRLINV